MKKAAISLLLLAGLFIVFGALAEPRPIELKTQSKEKIRSLADERPALMDALMPEEKKGTPKSLSSIPAPITSNVVYWIKKVIRSQWLPPDIEGNLVVLKDVKQWEKKDKHGVVFSERKGDFLILDYESGGNHFHIQESGVSVSVRVNFALPQTVIDDPKSFITKSVTEFLNLPGGVSLDLSITNVPPLYMTTIADNVVNSREWWHGMEVCTDGHFFFATVMEIEPADDNPQAQPGLPDRF